MGEIFETMMLVCFGVSWPFNIAKSYRSRTARGKSIGFQTLVIIGYICGVTGKMLTGKVSYVVAVYLLDLAMVSVDLALTIRNRRLDRLADEAAGK